MATEILILLRIDLTAEVQHAETCRGRDLLHYLAVFSQIRCVYNADWMAVDDDIEAI
jgi:hypothetical protein